MEKQNRINTKEELTQLLSGYKGILTPTMIDYLNSLIELKFSVIREYISDVERNALSELEVYKKVAIYNIYNRALNLLNERETHIFSKEEQPGILRIFKELNGREIDLFDFNYQEYFKRNNEVPKVDKTMEIGTISLYQTLENKDQRQKEFKSICFNQQILALQLRNFYLSHCGVISELDEAWLVSHWRDLANGHKRLIEIDRKNGLTDEDIKEIAITNQAHNWLLQDYGLTYQSFEEENTNRYQESMMKKTFVKRQPNLTIRDHIKYI